MCLGVPAKVVSVKGKMADVEIGGVIYQARMDLLEQVSLGDFVILHAGFAIEKVDAMEAAETLRLFNDVAALGEEEKESE